MCSTCRATVCGLTNRRSAICRLVRPAASWTSTSSSRADSSVDSRCRVACRRGRPPARSTRAASLVLPPAHEKPLRQSRTRPQRPHDRRAQHTPGRATLRCARRRRACASAPGIGSTPQHRQGGRSHHPTISTDPWPGRPSPQGAPKPTRSAIADSSSADTRRGGDIRQQPGGFRQLHTAAPAAKSTDPLLPSPAVSTLRRGAVAPREFQERQAWHRVVSVPTGIAVAPRGSIESALHTVQFASLIVR